MLLICLKAIMVGFMEHDGFQTVASAMSQGDGPQVSECSDMSLGQPKNKRRGLKHAMPTDAKARRWKRVLKVKVSLAGSVKKVKKSHKKKGTEKNSVANGRKERKCTLSRDSKGRFLPKESKGENNGENTTDTAINYGCVMNLQAPDFATILSIVKGRKGMKYCNKIRRLKDPDFVPLMDTMNNTERVTEDDNHYDVLKVLMRADGCSV